MTKFMKSLFCVFLILHIIFFHNLSASASLVDSIFQKYMESGPSYFESQRRGYFSFGSFSGRYDYGTLHPFSISPPRLNVGCGGIDIFFGGVGFTGLEYLVQKFQRLIQMAPAVAFHIALNTISPQLRGIINEVEMLINLLNQLQLDECKILKPFMAIDLSKGDIANQFEGAAKQAISSTGLTNLWDRVASSFRRLANAFTDWGSGSSGSNIPDLRREVKEATLDMCPPSVRRLVSDLESSASGCLVERYVREGRFNVSSGGILGDELVSIIRALIGDVCIRRLTGDSDDKLNPYHIDYIAPCNGAITRLKEGEFLKAVSMDRVNKRMVCSDRAVLTAKDLENKIANIISNAYSSYRLGVRPSNDFMLLANRSPFSLHKLMEYAVVVGDPTLPLSTAPYHAAFIVYNLISTIQTEIFNLAYQIRADVGSQPNYSDCPISGVLEGINRFPERDVINVATELYKILNIKSQELYYIVGVVNQYFQFYVYMENKLAKEFSPAVANRVLGRK